MSTRRGGVSRGAVRQPEPAATALGDDAAAVAANRRRFARGARRARRSACTRCTAREVVRLGRRRSAPARRRRGRCQRHAPSPAWPARCRWPTACRCCSPRPTGAASAAAHAGWRGLAGGVLEATLAALCEAAGCAPRDSCRPGSGPASGRASFEVGADVLQAFGADPRARRLAALRAARGRRQVAGRPGRPGARPAARAPASRRISGGQWCTVEDALTVLLVPARPASPAAWPPPSGSSRARLTRPRPPRPPRARRARRRAQHVQHDATAAARRTARR